MSYSEFERRLSQESKDIEARRFMYRRRAQLVRAIALPTIAMQESLGNIRQYNDFLTRLTGVNQSEVDDELRNLRELSHPYIFWSHIEQFTVNRDHGDAVRLADADPITMPGGGGELPREALLARVQGELAIATVTRTEHEMQGNLLQPLLPPSLRTQPTVQ